MDGQARAAARALRLPFARGADERRREASAIDEDERLLAAGKARGDGRAHRVADAVVLGGRAMRREAHDRQLRAHVRTMRKIEPAIASFTRCEPGLERGRRASQHDGNAAAVRAPDRGIARLIAHVVLLLVRGVVLLVHDDEAE
jgi:hypothetical protein